MNSRLVLSTLLSIFLSACGGDNVSDSSQNSASSLISSHSIEQIIALAYDTSYSVPAGFYVDERIDTPQSYSLYHVKDDSLSFELCAVDFAQALGWEEADNLSRAVNGFYVDSYENDMYYEFIRELSFPEDAGNVQDLTSPGFARVFKCDSVNRNGVDRNLRDGYAGTLNVDTLSAEVVRDFVEYLWPFTFFDTARPKVLDSASTENGLTYNQSLLLGSVVNQGSEQCDRIEVIEWRFSVDKSSGDITKSFQFRFAIEAQIVNGIPTQC